MCLRAPNISKFSRGACPQTPLGGAALRQLPTSWINKIIIAPPNQKFCLRPCNAGEGGAIIDHDWQGYYSISIAGGPVGQSFTGPLLFVLS